MTPAPPTASASAGSWSDEEVERAARIADATEAEFWSSPDRQIKPVFDQEDMIDPRILEGKRAAMRAALRSLNHEGEPK